MHKYKQNTDQSLYVDNSSRFPGMTELTDSEVEKQKQPLLNAPIGEKQINKHRAKRALEDQSALASFSAM